MDEKSRASNDTLLSADSFSFEYLHNRKPIVQSSCNIPLIKKQNRELLTDLALAFAFKDRPCELEKRWQHKHKLRNGRRAPCTRATLRSKTERERHGSLLLRRMAFPSRRFILVFGKKLMYRIVHVSFCECMFAQFRF